MDTRALVNIEKRSYRRISGSGGRPAASHQDARRNRGQATVELAFIVIMLTVMLAGTFEFGRAFSAWIQVGNIARAGAQYGTVAATLGDPNLEGVGDAALQEQSTIYGTAPSVAYEVLNDDYGFCAVRVTVDYDFEPLLGLGVLPGEITLTRTTQMRLQFVSAQMDMPDEASPCR